MATQDFANSPDNLGNASMDGDYSLTVNSPTSITIIIEGHDVVQLTGSGFVEDKSFGTITDIYSTGEYYYHYDSHYYDFTISLDEFLHGRIIGYDTNNNPITLTTEYGATIIGFDLLKYGDDLINGSTEKDYLDGGYGNDTLLGGGGNDVVTGAPGDDVIDGGSGDDDLSGGHGADIINGGDGDDTLCGNDREVGAAGYVFHPDMNRLNGGAGDDVIYAQVSSYNGVMSLSELPGGVVADGGSGTDKLVANFNYISDDIKLDWSDPSIKNVLPDGSSTQNIESYEIILGSGNDEVHDGSLDDTVDTGAGDDVVYYGGGRHDFSLGSGNDLFIVSGERIAEFLNTYGGVDPGDGFDLFVCDGSALTDGFDISGSGLFESSVILGGAGSDVISGSDGSDLLDGGAGADQLLGTPGDDTYIVDNSADSVSESVGDGIDIVYASADFTLQDGEEIEFLRAGADSKAVIAQWVTGGAYQPDPIKTGLRLTGNALAQTVSGGDGGDTLDGGGGADTLVGGLGNDTYVTDGGDDIVEAAGAGIDTVRSSVTLTLGANIENLILTGTSALDGTGNGLDNTISGNAAANALNGGGGSDTLNGGAGADLLTGGTGNDSFIVDNAGDRVVEASGGGVDKVFASTSYTLADGQEIEGLQLLASTGSANLNLTGNAISQSLVGNNGNNVLNGGVGADAMTGRGGNDTYVVDNLGDRITEAAGQGTDTVLAKASYALAAGQEIESLQLLASTGSTRLNLNGNEFGQSLSGNSGANVLDGKGGADVLTGRGGADSFLFSTALGAGNVDRITDFASEDTVRLSKSVFSVLATGQLAESAFKNLGTGSIDADDRVLYKQTTGELFYDADGSGKGVAVKFAVLDNHAALTHADFLVV